MPDIAHMTNVHSIFYLEKKNKSCSTNKKNHNLQDIYSMSKTLSCLGTQKEELHFAYLPKRNINLKVCHNGG
jgi:hypothetical protein